MAILCDGRSFLFYKFVDKRSAKGYPQIFLGKFPSGKKELAMPTGGDMNRAAFYQQIRRTCDTFYYVFLIGYQTGLEAYWERSVEKSKEEGKERDSTPGWYRATVLAKRAVGEAVSAWNLFDEGNFTESVQRGERAVKYLAERYVSSYPSLMAVNANNELLIIASRHLLSSRKVNFPIFPISLKWWTKCEISKGDMARLIFDTKHHKYEKFYMQVALPRMVMWMVV